VGEIEDMKDQKHISERMHELSRARHNPHQTSDRPLREIRRKKIEKEQEKHARQIKHLHTVGVEIYDALVKSNLKVRQNEAYRFALRYMLLDRDFTDDQGRLLLPSYKVAVWCGKQGMEQYINGNFDAGAFLMALKADVLPDLVVGDYDGPNKEERGQCRYVENDGLHGLVEHALNDFTEKERYDLLSMTRWNRTNAKANRDRLIEEALTQTWPYPQQARIAEYLHKLPFGLFAKQIPDRIEEARNYIKQTPTLGNKERRRELRILRRIEDCPQPIYFPGGSLRNARLFATDSLCDVERGARRILCRGWHEADLVACYPAIAASIWHIERIQSMLKQGIDVWGAISDELGVAPYESKWKREVVKEAGNRLLCGGLVSVCNDALSSGGIAGIVQESPTLMAIVEARGRAMRRARINGGTMTPVGWIDCHSHRQGDRPARSHMANVLAAYEIILIAPCYEVASESTDFTINIGQHDGFSVKLKREDRAEQILWRLNDAIAPVAQQYGITTRMVYKT
jgi:hypothetical protein